MGESTSYVERGMLIIINQMLRVAQLTNNTFDIVGREESNTSLIRNANEVRISWRNHANELEQLTKNEVMSAMRGSYLTARGHCLVPTGDKHTSIATLLAHPDDAVVTKNVVIDGVSHVARLLPVAITL